MQSFRRLDVFQKTNQDIDSSSSIGGIYSILALVVGVLLFVNEYQEWSVYKNVRKLEVQSLQEATIKANVDLTIFNAPCYLLSLDIADEVGNHISDYTETLQKIRYDSKNIIIEGVNYQSIMYLYNINLTSLNIKKFGQDNQNYIGSDQEVQDVINAIKSKEQCRFIGHVFLKTVPGNFHISFHSKMELMAKISRLDYEIFKNINVNHKINKLYFGNPTQSHTLETMHINQIQNKYQIIFKLKLKDLDQKNQILHILMIQDTIMKERMIMITILKYCLQMLQEQKRWDQNHRNHLDMQYLIKYTNSIFFQLSFYLQINNIYLFIQNIKAKKDDSVSVIYFRYEISPINLVYSRKRRSFYNFIVQVCAIIGGIFSVMGILNSLTTNVISTVKNR